MSPHHGVGLAIAHLRRSGHSDPESKWLDGTLAGAGELRDLGLPMISTDDISVDTAARWVTAVPTEPKRTRLCASAWSQCAPEPGDALASSAWAPVPEQLPHASSGRV
jgi:hypothetical protein